MKLFVTLIFAWSNSWAKVPTGSTYAIEQVIIDSSSPGKFSLSLKDYEDIRVDSDLDGKIDFWYLKSKSLEAGIRYKNGTAIQISIKKQISHNVFKEIILKKNSHSHFYIADSKTRSGLTLHGSIDDQCITAKKAFTAESQKLSTNITQSLIGKNLSTYISDSCYDASEVFSSNLESTLLKIFNDGLSSSPNAFHNCLSGSDTQKIFKNDSGESKLALEVLSSKMSLDFKKIANFPSEGKNPLFNCTIDPSNKNLNAKYQENDGITLNLPKEGLDKIPPAQVEKILRHELVHRAGIDDEAITEQLVNICPKEVNQRERIGPLAISNKSFGSTLTADNIVVSSDSVGSKAANTNETAKLDNTPKNSTSSRAPASATGGGGDGIDMKAEIAKAESVIPSAEKLAQTKVDKSPEGIQAAVKESIAESTPVLRMANQVMGAANTPAVAASTTLADSSTSEVAPSSSSSSTSSSSYDSPSYASSSDSGSSSSSSRRYQSKGSSSQGPSEVIASSSGPKVITTSRSVLAAGERVVEEIDLTKGTNTRTTSNSATSRSAANATREAPADRTTVAKSPSTVSVPAAPTNPGGEIASPGPITSGSSGGGGSTSLGGLGEPSPSNNAATTTRQVSGSRAPASATPSTPVTTQNSATSSREEIVTIFSRGSYSATRSKLQDAKFVNNLKTNKITIVDLYGNSFGASKGDVIFLDEGDKFVRQK